MLQAAILRFLFLLNLAQSPAYFPFNSTSNALSIVVNLPLTVPLYLYELGCASRNALFPGLKRRGLGLSPYSDTGGRRESHHEKKNVFESLTTFRFLAPPPSPKGWPRDLVKRPSPDEARKKALAFAVDTIPTPTELFFNPNRTIISNRAVVDLEERLATTSSPLATSTVIRRFSLLDVRDPPAPYTAVGFLEVGPWTILLVPSGSTYKPETSDLLKIVYQILIISVPSFLVFFANPSRLRPLLLSILLIHRLSYRCLLSITARLLPKLVALSDFLSQQLSTSFQYLFISEPEIPEEFMMTSDILLERLRIHEEARVSTQLGVYVIPQRRYESIWQSQSIVVEAESSWASDGSA